MTSLLLCLSFFWFAGGVAAQSPSETWITPGELLIQLKRGVELDSPAWEQLVARQQILDIAPISPALPQTYRLRFDPTRNPILLAQELVRSYLVRAAEPNYLRPTLALIPNDARYGDEWQAEFLQLPEAWEIEQGDPSVIIAIVDTGTTLDHVELKPNIWTNPGEIPDNGLDDDGNGYVDDVHGWDFVDAPSLPGRGDYEDRDNDPTDETGHGTHVMGIAGALGNNGEGIAGVAWHCTLMPVRSGFAVIGGGTFLQDDDSAAGIIYAADNGADVINLSWGDRVNSFVIRDAIEYAYQKGCILVAAAGNERSAEVLYPAALRQVISVSATDENDEHSYFANAGADVDIAAPGSVIWSTHIDGGYRRLSGTSMAAPHVAGAAALLLSKRPSLTGEDVRQILIATADRIQGSAKLVGAGRLNVARALMAASAPAARFTTPETGQGFDQEMTISGSAGGVGFESYQIFYGETSIPASWVAITSAVRGQHRNEPLLTWHTGDLEEGIYSLRLQVNLRGDRQLHDQVVVSIDHTPPVIEQVKVANWLQKEHYATLILWKTDDVTRSTVWVRTRDGLDDFEPLLTESSSQEHLFALSNYVDSGDYQVRIESRNVAGLTALDDREGLYYDAHVTHQSISPQGTEPISTGLPALHVATGLTDFNRNGRPEIVAMPTGGSGYAPVTIYEFGVEWTPLFTSGDEFFPWETGDLDGDGRQEILGNVEETTFLLEASQLGGFPTRRIWEASRIWGGQFAQIEGKTYLIARDSKLEQVALFRATGNDQIERVADLENPTEGRNDLATSFAVGDYDADGRIEIIAGDSDGDLLMYEHQGGDLFYLLWEHHFEGEKIQQLASGDTDGDGRAEFVVETRVDEDKFGLSHEHWTYRVFDRRSDNHYQIAWEQRILQTRPGGNGMVVAEVDSHPGAEILVVTWPNAYLFSFRDDTYQPIWYQEATSTFQPHVYDLDGDGQREFAFNAEEAFKLWEWQEDIASLVPWGVSVRPLDEGRVRVQWEHAPAVERFRIYRGLTEDALVPVAEVNDRDEFLDRGVHADTTYWYAVAGITQAGEETGRSEPSDVTPGAAPLLIEVEYLEPSFVKARFDQQMHSASQDIHSFTLTGPGIEATRPDSALLTDGEQSVLLRFSEVSFEPDQAYQLRVEWVYSDRKVAISPNPTEQSFRTPPVSPDPWQDLSQATVYPNPVRPSRDHPGWVTFANLPTGTEIRVYTVDGVLLANLRVLGTDRYQKRWYLDNGQQTVASGVYTYLLEWHGEHRIGSLAVVW